MIMCNADSLQRRRNFWSFRINLLSKLLLSVDTRVSSLSHWLLRPCINHHLQSIAKNGIFTLCNYGSYYIGNGSYGIYNAGFVLAEKRDISDWMNLMRLVIDGYPVMDEVDYLAKLEESIDENRALVLRDGNVLIGAMAFTYSSGSIEFLGRTSAISK